LPLVCFKGALVLAKGRVSSQTRNYSLPLCENSR
jgi:hypothetical protein